jgi:hypothetical protein
LCLTVLGRLNKSKISGTDGTTSNNIPQLIAHNRITADSLPVKNEDNKHETASIPSA